MMLARCATRWCAVLYAIGLLVTDVPAQTGTLDPGFLGQFAGLDQNGWDPSPVQAMAVQANGRILVGGPMTNVNGVFRLRLARLLPDGSLDSGFICHIPPGPPEPSWFNTTISALAVQPDGLILLGGNFTNVLGAARPGLARITTNGALDISFSPNIEAQPASPFFSQPLHIRTITLQPDGGIIIGGSFSHVGGVPRESVARLFPDGSLDTSFDPDPPRRSPASTERRNIYAALREPDGNLVIGGTYGVERLGLNGDRMARIGAFRTNGVSATVRALGRQADGSLVAGGSFDRLGSDTSTSAVARLRPDFTVDTAFNPRVRRSAIPSYSDGVNALHLQPDGMIVVGGSFDRVGNATVQGLARLLGNGSLDDTFDAEPFLPARNFPPYNDPFGENGYIQAMTALPDGGLLVAGNFRQLGDTAVTNVARLWPDGSPDTAFRVNGGGAYLNTTVDRDGRLLVHGEFTNLNGQIRRGFARLYANGTIDPDINLALQTTGSLGYASAVAVQKDGHYVVGGRFTTAGGYARTNLYRHYRNTGLADLGFEPHPGPLDSFGYISVDCLALDNLDNVYVGGYFDAIAGSNRTSFARLRPTGGLDPSFSNVVFTSSDIVTTGNILIMPDQKVVVVGSYTGVNGIARLSLVRLLTNGVVDTSFAVTATLSGAQNLIYDAVARADGKLVVRGTFDAINGAARGRVAILNTNGTVDPAVVTPPFFRSNFVSLLAQQADGSILIAGDLTATNTASLQIGLYSTNLALLTNRFPLIVASNRNGSTVSVTAELEKDGRIILGGNATHFNGVGVTGLVRVLNTPATSLLYAVNSARIRWARGGSTPEAQTVFFQLSTNNGVTWTELGTGTRTNGGWELGGLNLPLKGHLRGLARIPGIGIRVGQVAETVPYRLNFYQVVGAWMNFVTGTTNFLPVFTTFSADLDGDFISNGEEFAFGTLPNDEKSGPDPMRYVVTVNNTVTLVEPSAEVGLVSKFNADGTLLRGLFTRRADYVGSGLTYVPEFSTDLKIWRAVEATPEVLDAAGEYELVGIPLPGEVDGLPVQHFRVRILYSE